jgi:hypothetical protein
MVVVNVTFRLLYPGRRFSDINWMDWVGSRTRLEAAVETRISAPRPPLVVCGFTTVLTYSTQMEGYVLGKCPFLERKKREIK